jgi:L-2-hydroxyglutarate oxidase LhgO
VGLAIAARLAAREEGHTIVLERNAAVGMETSSRNSEVRAVGFCAVLRGRLGGWELG